MHSERPKLYAILAFLSAIGLTVVVIDIKYRQGMSKKLLIWILSHQSKQKAYFARNLILFKGQASSKIP